MIVLGIVLPIIGLLAKITVAWTIRPIALAVGLLLMLRAQSVIRPVAAAAKATDTLAGPKPISIPIEKPSARTDGPAGPPKAARMERLRGTGNGTGTATRGNLR